MATPHPTRPLRVLVRNLLLSALLAAVPYVVFFEFNASFFQSQGLAHPVFFV